MPEISGEAPESATDLLLRMNREVLRVPLSWVATTEEQHSTNFGDGLSAVVVTALAGIPAVRAEFDEACERITAVGTIGHEQKNGFVHIWGTGIDASLNPVTGAAPYTKPPNTEFLVHATRGPDSAATFRAAGIPAPDIYGDPVWLLPRFWPLDATEKTHDLGVVLHISELESETPEASVNAMYARYEIPADMVGQVKLINTYAAPTPAGMRAKVAEIVSCKRILSTSLHGLVVAETYGVPCAWFATYGHGVGASLDLTYQGGSIDHRIRDFYRGVGRTKLNAYLQDRAYPTDWAATMDFIDATWTRVSGYDGRALIDAFPLPLAVDPDTPIWDVPDSLFAPIHF